MKNTPRTHSARRRAGSVLKTAALYFFFVLYMVPFLMVLINSFKRKASIIKYPLDLVDSEGMQFENYVTAVEKMDFLKAFGNSLIVTACSIVFLVLLSSMMAYLFARKNWRECRISLSLLLASMILPFQVVMIPLVSIYGAQLQMLNSLPTLIFMNIGFGVSLCTFMCHGFIKSNIPVALEEAATIDGCSQFKCYFRIVLPLLKPILATISILETLSIWNDYLLPSLVLRRKELYTLPIAIRTFYGTFSNDYGYIMAGLVLSIVPVIIVYLCLQKHIIGGVVAGAVKA